LKKIEVFRKRAAQTALPGEKGRAATRALEILFRDAGTVLRKRLDKLVPQFKNSAPGVRGI
jgi:hypothetical protein